MNNGEKMETIVVPLDWRWGEDTCLATAWVDAPRKERIGSMCCFGVLEEARGTLTPDTCSNGYPDWLTVLVDTDDHGHEAYEEGDPRLERIRDRDRITDANGRAWEALMDCATGQISVEEMNKRRSKVADRLRLLLDEAGKKYLNKRVKIRYRKLTKADVQAYREENVSRHYLIGRCSDGLEDH